MTLAGAPRVPRAGGLLLAGALFLQVIAIQPAAAAGLEQSWQPPAMAVRAGTLLPSPGVEEFRLRLSADGLAVLELPTARLPLDRMKQFRLVLGKLYEEVEVDLVWWLVVGEKIASYDLVPTAGTERLADLRTRDDWPETISAIALRFRGPPGTVLMVERIELRGWEGWENLSALKAAVRSVWSPTPWDNSSINAYFLPYGWWQGVPLVAWLGVLSLAVLIGVLALSRRARASRSVLVVICFLPAWLFFDAGWMRQLGHRAHDTARTYAGKTEAEALLAGADAPLVKRAAAVSAQLPVDTRLFVVTQADYAGMRQAYYLYPRNVYWMRGEPKLPGPEQLRPGDAILLLSPTRFGFNEISGRLYWPDQGGSLPARILWRDASSRLLIVGGDGL